MSLILVAAYGLIGGMVALIDRLEDENEKRSELEPIFLAVVASFLMGYLIAVDEGSAIIFTAILLGVIFGGKVDALPWLIGILIAGGGLLSRILYDDFLAIIALPISLGVCGFLDEFGHERVPKIRDGLIQWFFLRRMTLKLGMFAAAFFGAITSWHFIAFLAWDLAYEIVASKK
ncbi:MAG: hypothetical protein ABIG96_06720 [Candidatus Micrarchaeota archaeon]